MEHSLVLRSIIGGELSDGTAQRVSREKEFTEASLLQLKHLIAIRWIARWVIQWIV